jgi:hypothetical protein
MFSSKFIFIFIALICLADCKCQLSFVDYYAYHRGGISLVDSCNDMETFQTCKRTRDVIQSFLKDYNDHHSTALKIQDMPCESHISCSMDLANVQSGNSNAGQWRSTRCKNPGRVDCTAITTQTRKIFSFIYLKLK